MGIRKVATGNPEIKIVADVVLTLKSPPWIESWLAVAVMVKLAFVKGMPPRVPEPVPWKV